MEFVAIDFETANADLSSICQIGIVKFKNGNISEKWQSIVNPEDFFDPINTYIHGIDEAMVSSAPIFPGLFNKLSEFLSNNIIACHTHFDRVAFSKVIEKYNLSQIRCTWIDTAKVARRAWSEFAYSGYGLKNVAQNLGIEFNHHNAEEDAKAAGEILVRAISKTGIDLEGWLVRVNQPINPASAQKVSRKGNPEGSLAGEIVVFTGALSIPRREAADMAANAGCEVSPSVKKSTTLLVVGDQDIRRLAGHDKSSKHRKAEELIGKGKPIRIIGESDFLKIINDAAEPGA